MENQSIYHKICNIQISPNNFDPARLLSICLLHSLNKVEACGGHFPPESNDDSLPWFLYKSFFYGMDIHKLSYCTQHNALYNDEQV